jgi:hypothetical protein
MRRNAIWLTLYLLWMALLFAALFWGRHAALRAYSGIQAQEEWEAFREDMARIGREGPVQRRTPKSNEPPALVLMRDYFAVCLVGTFVFGTAVFATLGYAVVGALSRDYTPRDMP